MTERRTLSRGTTAMIIPVPGLVFRRKALAAAVAFAVVQGPVVAHAKEWKPNVELRGMIGTERALGGVQALVPFYQTSRTMGYIDLRGLYQSEGVNEFNFGGGYRSLTQDGKWILGGYGAFDTRESETGNRFNQFTLGVEALGDVWDARANGYIPITDEEVVGPGERGGTFVGNRLFANGVVEEAMPGLDFELGRLLPIYEQYAETRLFIGGFHFMGDAAPNSTGAQARLEVRPYQALTLELSGRYDDLFEDEVNFEVRWSFGYPFKRGKRTLRERMIQFVQRDIDIVETSPLGGFESDDPGNRFDVTPAGGVWHIDNSVAVNGSGTFESPFMTVADCQAVAAACLSNNTLIYFHEGVSANTPYDTNTFLMTSSQQLIGTGVSLFGIGGQGVFPVVTTTNGGNIINLNGNPAINNGNVKVAGLRLDGSVGNTNHGIYGRNVAGFDIRSNQIVDVGGSGIFIRNGGQSLNNHSIIAGNTIDNTNGYGIFLANEAGDGETITQSVDIIGNVITRNSEDGIVAYNNADTGGTSTQTLNIVGNTINENNSAGIYLRNEASGGTATQVADVWNNTIRDNGSDGVRIYNEGSAGTATQTIALTDNIIVNNDSNGVVLLNREKSANSTAIQNATISGNRITSNGSHGVYIENSTENSTSTATQTVSMHDNDISRNQSNGLYIYNGSNEGGGTATQVVDAWNNTIDNNGSLGVIVLNRASEGPGIARQTVNLTSNSIDNNDSGGLYISNRAFDASRATQNVTLSGNTIDGNGSVGVYVLNRSFETGTANQTLVLQNNTINNSYAEGLNIDNITEAAGGTANQNLTLTGNTISGSGEAGIYLGNRGDGGGKATQTATFTNNVINNSGSDGVYLINGGFSAAAGSVSTQNVVMTGNTINGSRYNGLYIRNRSDEGGGTATQTVNLGGGGNTITDSGEYGVRIYNENAAGATQRVDLRGGNTIANNDTGDVYKNGTPNQTVFLP